MIKKIENEERLRKNVIANGYIQIGQGNYFEKPFCYWSKSKPDSRFHLKIDEDAIKLHIDIYKNNKKTKYLQKHKIIHNHQFIKEELEQLLK